MDDVMSRGSSRRGREEKMKREIGREMEERNEREKREEKMKKS